MSPQNYQRIYSIGLLIYPFSILFCPPLNFGLFYARIDEILVLFFVPIVFADLKNRLNYTYKSFSYKLMKPYAILFLLFFWGIVWGNSFDNLGTSYVRQIFRPLYLILIVYSVRIILIRAKIDNSLVLLSILFTLCLAGFLGYYAMYAPGFSTKLIQLYTPEIEFNKYFHYTFDMSVRAMSVFYGYDQASVSYAFGCILSLALFMNVKKDLNFKIIIIMSIFVLFGSIVSSARIGFLSVLGGGFVLLLLPSGKSPGSKLMLLLIVICFIVSLSYFGTLFPNSKTFERFSDVLKIFSSDKTTSFVERSEGLSGVIETQIQDKTYPDGIDMVFGFGDDTSFVSDVAYVTIFIKYGLVGLFVVFYIFYIWISLGIRMTIYGVRNKIPLERRTAFFILPGIAVLFLIAAMKGPLYFISLKTGELVSVLLGLALFEHQSILNREIEK